MLACAEMLSLTALILILFNPIALAVVGLNVTSQIGIALSVLIVMSLKHALTVIHLTLLVHFMNVVRYGRMAKGGYFIIGYPVGFSKTPCVPDSIVDSIQKMGGEVAYILHDKDHNKQHYHFLCMWSKSVPPWESFVEWMKKYNTFAFDDLHRGKTEEENKYCRRVAVVRDVDACLHYMLHE